MSTIQIQLNSIHYQVGDTITGTLVCNLRSEKQFRSIVVQLKCKESTHWTETESYYDSETKRHRTRLVSYSGDNTIHHNQIILREEGTLAVGHHTFPISFKLPEHLPASFDCNYGSIRYTMKAVMDRPWKIDMEDRRVLNVISPIRLDNIEENAREPRTWSDDKTVCCLCCASGPVELTVSLDKQAFVIGENVNVNTYCLNMSNVNVENITYTLKSEITYKTTSPKSDYKYDTELLTSFVEGGVGAHGERNCNTVLEIPPSTPVHNFTGCELFEYSIELKVTAEISGCHSNLDIYGSIFLGHIPFTTPTAPSFVSSPPSIGFLPVQNAYGNKPMPLPEDADTTLMPPPYPSNPSAPTEPAAASAPPKSLVADTTLDDETNKAPPPSYDEATQILKPK